MIIEKFYTYEELGEDLVIYTWQFQERNNDGLLVYYNEQTDNYTECYDYDTSDEFARENDVFLSRLDVVFEFEDLESLDTLGLGDDFE